MLRLAVLLAAPALSACGEQSSEKPIPVEEVERRVQQYVDVVLGEKAPTVDDYEGFERAAFEVEAIALECKHEVGVDYVDASRRAYASACESWVNQEGLGTPQGRSAYYSLLRKKLGLEATQVRLKGVRVDQSNPDSVYWIDAEGPMGSPRLQFYHARYRRQMDLGGVGLDKVDGVGVRSYLGLDPQSAGAASTN